MLKLSYVRQPGFISDWVFLPSLYFNPDRAMTDGVNPEKRQSDIAHYRSLIEYFGPFPPELFAFFYLKKHVFSFMGQFVIVKEDLLEENLLEKIYAQLTDSEQITREVFAHYYADQPAIDTLTLPEATAIVMGADDPDEFKARMMAFLISPEKILRLLVDTMRETEEKLNRYYEENSALLLNIQKATDRKKIEDFYTNNREMNLELDPLQEYRYSLCLATKNTIAGPDTHTHLMIFGYDYADMMAVLLHSQGLPDLVRFGKVLSEPNRKKILDLIAEVGELCAADIVEYLSLSPAVVYYHLTVLTEIHMVCFRSVGRTIYYRINGAYFVKVRTALKPYAAESQAKIACSP